MNPHLITPANEQEFRSLMARLGNERRPIWILDPSDRFTDMRAIRNGQQVRLNLNTHLNPFHPCLAHAEDAADLSNLLGTLIPGVDRVKAEQALKRALEAHRQGQVFTGTTLQALADAWQRHPQENELFQAVYQYAEQHPEVVNLISGKTTLPKATMLQLCYPPNKEMHAAVHLTTQRLAAITTRSRSGGVIFIVSETSSLDTPALAQQVWEKPVPGVVHIRVLSKN